MNELMKILVAYDGSTSADDALGDLPRAGLPRQADVLIVHIQENWQSPPSSAGESVGAQKVVSNSAAIAAQSARNARKEAPSEIENELAAMLARASERLTSFFPEWTTQTLILRNSPAREIIRQAEDWNADLIVVGSHGHAGIKQPAMGSISQKIANEAACSVRVVRRETWKNGSPSRLLIGFDGTLAAQAAVEAAARRFWIMGSEARLVIVPEKSHEDSEQLRESVAEARKMLERSELSVSELIEEGNPKQILIAAAEEWGADCIFLGANDAENATENHLLGSVSTAVVARAHCTVEIARQRKSR